MISVIENPRAGSGFDVLHIFEGWKVAFITYADQYAEAKELKRHLYTDEAFSLVLGEATMFTLDERGELFMITMERGKLYNVECGTWHHIKVSADALVIVVENSTTDKGATEIMTL